MSKATKSARRALAARIEELAANANAHDLHQLAQAWREITYGATGGRSHNQYDTTTINRHEDPPAKGAGFS